MGEYDDLATIAEAGKLQPAGESLSRAAAVELGQQVLMEGNRH